MKRTLPNFLNLTGKTYYLQGILIIVTLLVYYPMLNSGFFKFAADDMWNLYDNPLVESLDLENLSDYFIHPYQGQYSPVNTLLYGIIYQFVELDPFYYHLFCLVIHVFNGLLVYRLVNLLSKIDADKRCSINHLRENKVAFLAALIFLINPMQVQSVAWIAASKIVLYTFFYLLSLLSYLQYLRKQEVKFYFICLLTFVLSFGSKEQAVILPLSFILVDYYFEVKKDIRTHFAEKFPFFLLSIIFSLISISAQQSVFGDQLTTNYYPFYQRIFLGFSALISYFAKALLPFNLKFYNDFPMQPGFGLPPIYFFSSIVFFAAFFFVIKFYIRKKIIVVWGILFFTVNMLLTIHIIPMSRYYMSDRYVYISMIGTSFVISHIFISEIASTQRYIWRMLMFIGLIVYVIYLGTYSFLYSPYY
jgi:hypothetical protein